MDGKSRIEDFKRNTKQRNYSNFDNPFENVQYTRIKPQKPKSITIVSFISDKLVNQCCTRFKSRRL